MGHTIELQKAIVYKIFFYKIWANPGLFFIYFCPFHITIQFQIEKGIDGELGIQTQSHRIVGTDKTTELWRKHIVRKIFTSTLNFNYFLDS